MRKSIRQVVIVTFALLIVGGMVEMKAQKLALKTNVASWMTTTVNAGAEIKIAPRWSAELNVMYKPWSFLSDNRKVMGLLVQPELRYWFCQPFYQHFLGLHMHYGQYNGGLKEYRYQGDLYGAGLTYGYQWILGQNWNLELNAGVGYARMKYDKYERPKCGLFMGNESRNYFGLTKLSVSFVYILKN